MIYVFTESNYIILCSNCLNNIHESLNFREKFVKEYHTPIRSYENFVCDAGKKMICYCIIHNCISSKKTCYLNTSLQKLFASLLVMFEEFLCICVFLDEEI